ncbi:hypothetical protein [Aeromonas salmonicida]|uniref:hypothetical protein n=1 Tax=Aeromonas salmonicida TaxID=645 RepID=UPI00370D0BE5
MMAPGATAPRVVNHDHIVRMKPDSAIVDMTQIRARPDNAAEIPGGPRPPRANSQATPNLAPANALL